MGFRKKDIRMSGKVIRDSRQTNSARIARPAAKIVPSSTDSPFEGA
jgi:hypothetical protein